MNIKEGGFRDPQGASLGTHIPFPERFCLRKTDTIAIGVVCDPVAYNHEYIMCASLYLIRLAVSKHPKNNSD